MDTAGFGLLITAVSGAVLGAATLINNRKTSKITSRVEDTRVAFDALNNTVKTLSDENARIQSEFEEVRKEYEECERARKELKTIVGNQGDKISTLNTAVENLTMRIQEILAR